MNDGRRGQGTLLNSTSLTPKPLASSVYMHVPEAISPHKRSISVTSLFPFPGLELRTTATAVQIKHARRTAPTGLSQSASESGGNWRQRTKK